MLSGAIEIITGRERRRRWSTEEKLRIVAETEECSVRIGDVAARHDVYPSLLSTWRRQVREGRLGRECRGGFVPVRLVARSPEATALAGCPPASGAIDAAGIEIILADGTRLYIRHAAQLPLLRPVIAALRG
jgi:transposase